MKKDNIITLSGDDGDIEVEVIEETEYNGVKYLLVADVTDSDEDEDCYILKDTSPSDADNADYEIASDEDADIVFEIFNKKLDEVVLRKD